MPPPPPAAGAAAAVALRQPCRARTTVCVCVCVCVFKPFYTVEPGGRVKLNSDISWPKPGVVKADRPVPNVLSLSGSPPAASDVASTAMATDAENKACTIINQ